MTALAGVFADILLPSGASLSIPVNTALTDSGDHTTFQLAYNSTFRGWDKSVAMTFQTSPDGSTGWVNTTPKTIVFDAGKVTFSSAVSGATPSARITVGNYFVLTSVGNCTEWSASLAAKSVDATTMKGVGGSAWEDNQVTTLGGMFSIKKWWVDNTFFNHVTARDLLLLSCLTPDGHHFDAYGFFSDNSIKLAVAGLVESDLSFKATDVVSYL